MVSRSRLRATVLLPLMAVLVGGCASWDYYVGEFSASPGEPKTAFIDIKQRAILTGRRPVGPKRDADVSDRVVCAEPSPEGLASALTELAASGKFKEVASGSLSATRQYADSFIGMRTQTIQLLRDGMYRLCEAYLSGALDRGEFAWMTRRYQKYMVALLTIEQLTQVAQAPAVAQKLQASTMLGRSTEALLESEQHLADQIRMSEEEQAKIEKEQADLEKSSDPDNIKVQKQKDLAARLQDVKRTIAQSEDARTMVRKAISASLSAHIEGTITPQITPASALNRRIDDKTAVENVTSAIEAITLAILKEDDLPIICLTYLKQAAYTNAASTAATTDQNPPRRTEPAGTGDKAAANPETKRIENTDLTPKRNDGGNQDLRTSCQKLVADAVGKTVSGTAERSNEENAGRPKWFSNGIEIPSDRRAPLQDNFELWSIPKGFR